MNPDSLREKMRKRSGQRRVVSMPQIQELKPPQKKPFTVGQRDYAHKKKERLPHGSCFHVSYDAVTQTWSGTLSVPGVPLFPATEHGLFKLCELLDTMWRKWRDAQKNGNTVKGDVNILSDLCGKFVYAYTCGLCNQSFHSDKDELILPIVCINCALQEGETARLNVNRKVES